jgi:hypothetical protein
LALRTVWLTCVRTTTRRHWWKTAAYALADRHDVGLEAELFGRPHRSVSAEAGQDFISDEQRANSSAIPAA